MGNFLKCFLILICISNGLICSILLYSNGFLLSRNIITFKSNCTTVDSEFGYKWNHSENVKSFELNQRCFISRTRVILIVIDALRYDFVARQESKNEKNYHNKFKFVQKLLLDSDRSTLHKFTADPPTTTMQRLHGMMTGSLPTFIDVGSNFASSEIIEDNLLFQLKAHNKTVVFLGDDTWINLFPSQFNRHFAFPSFDVWDLDTVDRGISKHIWSEIEKNDWDLLIAHFLGVDHCGHRYGPSHSEMVRKLAEMDRVIEKVVRTMDNDTVLFVIGDHGMTDNGDHGGDSYEEVTAAIFVYSPSGLNKFNNATASYNQIDLLPTLSSVLGVPIPFSNLGSLIPKFLPNSLFSFSNSSRQYYLMNNNVDQVTAYIKEYSKINRHFASELLENTTSQYLKLRLMKRNNNFFGEAESYLQYVQKICRRVWTQFDFVSIFLGLASLITLLILLLFIQSSFFVIDKIGLRDIIFYIIAVSTLFFLSNFLLNVRSTFYLVSCVGFVILLLHSNFLCIELCKIFDYYSRFENFFSTVIFIISTLGLFSNSFIMSDGSVVTFLLITVLLSLCCQVLFPRTFSKGIKPKFKLLIVCLTVVLCIIFRFLPYFWSDYDHQFVESEPNKSSSFLLSLFNTLTVIFFYSIVNLLHYKLINYFPMTKLKIIELFLLMPLVLFNLVKYFLPSLETAYLDSFLNVVPVAICFVSFLMIIACITFPVFSLKNLTFSVMQFNFHTTNFKLLLLVYSQLYLICFIFSLVIMNERKLVSVVILFLSLAIVLILLGSIKLILFKNEIELINYSLIELLVWHLSSFVHFYGTGHQPTFPSLQWDAVGPFTHLPLFIPGTLIVINTFLSQIVHALFFPLISIVPFILYLSPFFQITSNFETIAQIRQQNLTETLFSQCILYLNLHGFRVLTIMASAAIHSRHLMVWKIFAPKFIFEGIGFIVTIIFLLIGYIFAERVISQLENFLMNRINENYIKKQ